MAVYLSPCVSSIRWAVSQSQTVAATMEALVIAS